MTYAINGFEGLVSSDLEPVFEDTDAFTIYPNPATRVVFFNKATDAALYDAEGKRLNVFRNATEIDVTYLAPGIYFIQNAEGDIQKLIIQ